LLLVGDGVPGKQIAARVGCAEPTVVTWRGRYGESGLAGLEDLPRPGKPSPLPESLRDRVLELTPGSAVDGHTRQVAREKLLVGGLWRSREPRMCRYTFRPSRGCLFW